MSRMQPSFHLGASVLKQNVLALLMIVLFLIPASTHARISVNLPVELLNTQPNPDYPETQETFVPYPDAAQDLLAIEKTNITEPVTLEITTTVTHWHHPLWTLLQGIIQRLHRPNSLLHVQAHSYIVDGYDRGCRTTTEGGDYFEEVQSLECQQYCTNHGRYCAVASSDYNSATNPPRLIVEETLRRMCIQELYMATSWKHWQYLELFEELQCQQQIDMTNCAQQALAQVHGADWYEVKECMERSGGLEDDSMNEKLEEQLDRQLNDEEMQHVPFLVINGEVYTGKWEVSSLFRAVCDAYPSDAMAPMACQFCGACEAVRHCLWYLECGDQPFDVNFIKTEPKASASVATSPPLPATSFWSSDDEAASSTTTAATTAPAPAPAPAPASNQNNDNIPMDSTADDDNDMFEDAKQNKEKPSTNQSNDSPVYEAEKPTNRSIYIMGGILLGLLIGVMPGCYLYREEKRIRAQLDNVKTARAKTDLEGSWFTSSISGNPATNNGNGIQGINVGPYHDDINHSRRRSSHQLHLHSEPFHDVDDPEEDELQLSIGSRPDHQNPEAFTDMEDVDIHLDAGLRNNVGETRVNLDNQNKQPEKRPPRFSFKLHNLV